MNADTQAFSLIDSHCHLDLPAFAADLPAVLARSQAQGVNRWHIPGTTPEGWARQLEIQSQHPFIDLSFGLHPYFLSSHSELLLEQLESSLGQHRDRIVAVGEIGLDAAIDIPAKSQEQMFLAQLSMAKALGLPVIVHHRKTHHRIIGLLKQAKFTNGGVVHAFSGSTDVANAYVDMGFCLGVGGTITYERARKTRSALANVPLEALVLETDSPDMPMAGFQGLRNEPARLPDVLRALADIRQQPQHVIAHTASANYLRTMRLLNE